MTTLSRPQLLAQPLRRTKDRHAPLAPDRSTQRAQARIDRPPSTHTRRLRHDRHRHRTQDAAETDHTRHPNGYHAHVRHGLLPACDECREAYAAAKRAAARAAAGPRRRTPAEPRTQTNGWTPDELIAEIAHLWGTDTPANIADRLGVTCASLSQIYRRRDNLDMAAEFDRARRDR